MHTAALPDTADQDHGSNSDQSQLGGFRLFFLIVISPPPLLLILSLHPRELGHKEGALFIGKKSVSGVGQKDVSGNELC